MTLNNGTNFISLGDGIGKDEFLISALNSSPMEYVFRRLNSNVHVSAGEINALPFPPEPDKEILDEIRALVSKLIELGGVDSNPKAIHEAIDKERQLDKVIGTIYGLTDTEIEEIQNRLPPYEQVYGLK